MSTEDTKSELDRLAHEIATDEAVNTIHSHSLPMPLPPSVSEKERWYDIAHGPKGREMADVKRAVRYLELRGLLERLPNDQNLVRVTRT